jgi:zinc/manganese transport system substrate-binding protein
MRLALLLPALCATLALASCGDDPAGAGDGRVRVVATTTHAADLVRSIGGERVEVHGILSPNSDPHDYEPRPSDARAVAEATLVVRSGGEVDEWLDDVISGAGGDAGRISLIDSVQTIGDDPHWWQDPRNVERAVPAIRDALEKADPDGAAAYRENAAAYLRKVEALDRGIGACMRRVPDSERKLVTSHDALRYFARRYDVRVVGALIPSTTSQAQPSAGETARLVRQIERERVNAIFPESALNPRLERAVSRETGARVGGTLWADALGPKGSSGETYLDAMATNTEEMVDGFTGGRLSCRP